MGINKTMQINNMIMIGATGRNSGKTTLARKIINKYKNQKTIYAFKIITISNQNDVCQRGGEGCGICQGLKEPYDISRETGNGMKDTMLLKEAGAEQVYLIRTLKQHIKEAIEAALTLVPKDAIIICESNSGRLVARPALFVMIKSSKNDSIKPSAAAVINLADIILEQDEKIIEHFINEVESLYFGEN